MSDQEAENRMVSPSAHNENKRGDERRQYRRTTLKTAIHISSESNFYTGFMNDLSEGGLFVATHNILERGSVIDLEFSLPDDNSPIRVQGEVRWIKEYNPGSDGHPGMGFRFINLPEQDRLRIERFVKIRDTIFFDD